MWDNSGMNIRRENFIPKELREKKNGHRGMIFWFCGLSGAGKTTIARAFEEHLFEDGKQVVVLDGDNLRHGLNSDLGFSLEDREENLRRMAHLAELFASTGFIVLVSVISPMKKHSDFARSVATSPFILVYVSTDLKVCEERDVKGLYKKARNGEIKEMTGISSPFEVPKNPDVVIDSVQSLDLLNAFIVSLDT